MNLVLVPLTTKLLFVLPNLLLKNQTEKKTQTFTNKDRYLNGKDAYENGAASAQRKFQSSHGAIGDSTVRLFKKKYKGMIKDAARKKVSPKKAIAARKRGRPVLLGEIDEMVQRFLLAVRKQRRSCKCCCCQISC